jgi:hypothetical protein
VKMWTLNGCPVRQAQADPADQLVRLGNDSGNEPKRIGRCHPRRNRPDGISIAGRRRASAGCSRRSGCGGGRKHAAQRVEGRQRASVLGPQGPDRRVGSAGAATAPSHIARSTSRHSGFSSTCGEVHSDQACAGTSGDLDAVAPRRRGRAATRPAACATRRPPRRYPPS